MVAAFSFGKAQRPAPPQTPSPGVGNYYPYRQHNRRPPTWKIGTATRSDKEIRKIPGPGQYEQIPKPTKRHFPEYSFGEKNQNVIKQTETMPGPGTYDQDFRPLLKSSSSYTMRQRVKIGGIDDYLRETKNGPGPAAYDTNYSTVITRPSSKIGNQNRGGFYDSKPFIPGVGNYNVRPGTSGPFHRFGNATRDSYFTERITTPGPGQYMHNSTLNIKAVTMSTKRVPTASDSQPGPGHYDPSTDFTKRSIPGCRVGTAKQRQVFDAKNTPGPGAYQQADVTKRRPPSCKVGQERRGIMDNQEIPGPGTYDINRESGGKAYTLRPKYTDRQVDKTPGPLDYNPSIIQTKNRPASCRVGTETREQKLGNSNPGPNHYQVSDTNRQFMHQFGSESRIQNEMKESNVPGPGTYNIPATFANVPSYLMPQKREY